MSTVAIASAAAIPSPSIAATGPADPIFAAIERHRRSILDWMQQVKIQGDLEQMISPDKWQKDRRWIAACRQYDAASDERDGSTSALLEIVPTSLRGVVALLDYVDEVVRGGVRISDTNYSGEWLFPERLVDDAIIDHRGRPVEMPFSYWVMRNIRAGLANSVDMSSLPIATSSPTPARDTGLENDRLLSLLRRYEEGWGIVASTEVPEGHDELWDEVFDKHVAPPRDAIIKEKRAPTTAVGAIAALNHVMQDAEFDDREMNPNLMMMWLLLRGARDYVAAAAAKGDIQKNVELIPLIRAAG